MSIDDRIGEAFAQTMQEPAFAMAVRDRLRASRFTQHKVQLGGLLSSKEMAPFAERFFQNLSTHGVRSDVVLERARVLALWMPNRTQRLSWNGRGRVVVVAKTSKGAKPTVAFGSDGRSSLVEELLLPAARENSGAPLFVIAPFDALIPRNGEVRISTRETVQDPQEVEAGGLLVTRLQNGDSVMTPIDVTSRNGAPASTSFARARLSTPPSGTSLKSLYVINGEDFGSFSNPLELRWVSSLKRRSDQSTIRTSTLYVDGYNQFIGEVSLPMLDAVQSPTSYIDVSLKENDGWWADDDYGFYQLIDETKNALNAPALEPRLGGGSDRCGAITSLGAFECPYSSSGRLFFWREVSFSLQWPSFTAPPARPQIVGDSYIYPYQLVTWTAGYVPGGAAPYSYRWYLDGQLVGTGSSYQQSFNTPATSHELVLDVMDGGTYWDQQSIPVNVNSGSCPPGSTGCNESLRKPFDSASTAGSERNRGSTPKKAGRAR
ncbi:hypothetical protein [Gemmatimonas groenlandica]|uniref:PKD domain-containing protein n=1 Tax=Gemmatimonas groenlandica TaxID=2732249 RepID=A0A6M4IP77_9BACT|nr:hypothetical protein [Gemmatimonas groenlandica]QJR35539.1 hypothetical protein HKW67_08475 [Gemmatimonas groenlandica]